MEVEQTSLNHFGPHVGSKPIIRRDQTVSRLSRLVTALTSSETRILTSSETRI